VLLACRAPEAPVVSLTPEGPTTWDDLVVVIDTPSEGADGYRYRWSLDGRARDDQFLDTLADWVTVPGDEWAVEVVPLFGDREGSPGRASVVILPSVAGASISPERPTARDALTVTVGTVYGDATTRIVWRADGEEVGEGGTLAPLVVYRDQHVTAEVVPAIGDLVGPSVVTAEVIVANAYPGAPVAEVAPSASLTPTDLVCRLVADAADPDGDPVGYTFSWWVDGAPWEGPVETTTHPGDTVAGGALAGGAAWTCLITPNDGELDGPPGLARALVGDPCSEGVDALTQPVHASFVLHSEEDDPDGIAGSNPDEPDYNGDPAVFAHYADAMWAFATALSAAGATLSIQPEWTFVEGVVTWRPTLFAELRALPGVEIAPHGHETVVLYDELFERLAAADAAPKPYLGGMVFEMYVTRAEWFALHPMFALWEAPTVSPDHEDDVLAPAMVYRSPLPGDVEVIDDLFRMQARSPLIVTPAVASVSPGPGNVDPELWLTNQPAGRYFAPAYIRYSLRDFRAEATDTAVPEQWRADDPYKVEAAVIADAVEVTGYIQRFVDGGTVRWTPISELISMYTRYESCLDLTDGQDLSPYVPDPPADTGS
jgi:hypothetical protein